MEKAPTSTESSMFEKFAEVESVLYTQNTNDRNLAIYHIVLENLASINL